MIEVILSPDLRLQQRQEEALALRLAAARLLQVGLTYRPGPTGTPGVLESVSKEGFVSLRWPDGSLLCGVGADELIPQEQA